MKTYTISQQQRIARMPGTFHDWARMRMLHTWHIRKLRVFVLHWGGVEIMLLGKTGGFEFTINPEIVEDLPGAIPYRAFLADILRKMRRQMKENNIT